MNKNRRRGKDYERWLAQDNQGRRVGILGQEDVEMQGISAECKERQILPVFIRKCFEQAQINCKQEHFPAVFLHICGDNHYGDIVMMKYCDWKMFYESWKREKCL